MSNEMETRTVNAPRPGTKVSLILAAGLLAVAVYYYTLPTHFMGKDGGLFGCGSPLSPNNSPLGKSQCHIIENQGLHKALLFLALALICAILGTLLFGIEKSEQSRRTRSRLDDEDDEHLEADDRSDEPETGRRSRLLAGREERREQPRHRAPAAKTRRPRLGDEDQVDDAPRSRRLVEDRADDDTRGARERDERRVSRYDADAFEDTAE